MGNRMTCHHLPPSELRPTDDSYKYIWDVDGSIPLYGTNPTGRTWAASCIDHQRRKLYVMGGNRHPNIECFGAFPSYDGPVGSVTSNTLSDLIEVDLDTMSSKHLLTLSVPRMGAAMGVYNGRLYIVGGCRLTGTLYSNSSQICTTYSALLNASNVVTVDLGVDLSYPPNAADNANRVILSLPSGSLIHPAYVTVGSRIYLFGGMQRADIANMGTSANGAGLDGFWRTTSKTVATTWNSYLAGANKTCYVYDMATNSLESLPNLPMGGNAYLRATPSLTNPRIIYIANTAGQLCSYNTETQKYTTHPSYTATTKDSALYAVMDGGEKIVSSGGMVGSIHCEAYDPAANAVSRYPYAPYNKNGDTIEYYNGHVYQICGAGDHSTSNSILCLRRYDVIPREASPTTSKHRSAMCNTNTTRRAIRSRCTPD